MSSITIKNQMLDIQKEIYNMMIKYYNIDIDWNELASEILLVEKSNSNLSKELQNYKTSFLAGAFKYIKNTYPLDDKERQLLKDMFNTYWKFVDSQFGHWVNLENYAKCVNTIKDEQKEVLSDGMYDLLSDMLLALYGWIIQSGRCDDLN